MDLKSKRCWKLNNSSKKQNIIINWTTKEDLVTIPITGLLAPLLFCKFCNCFTIFLFLPMLSGHFHIPPGLARSNCWLEYTYFTNFLILPESFWDVELSRGLWALTPGTIWSLSESPFPPSLPVALLVFLLQSLEPKCGWEIDLILILVLTLPVE